MDERKLELERIEQELLDELLQEDQEKQKAEPAFENPDEIRDPEEPLVYCNYSNDYGKDPEQLAEEIKADPAPAQQKHDKIIIGLMLGVSVLCLGIIGVMIYWLETLLKLL